MVNQTTILEKLESFTEMLAESAMLLTPMFPGSEDKFYGIGVSKASPILDTPAEEFYVVNVWSVNGEIVFTALFFDENHIVVNGIEVSHDEALAIANEKMGGTVGSIVGGPVSNVPVAALASITEMPTFQSKVALALEGDDGLFHVIFSKNHRIDTDCYGHTSEDTAYEITLYETLGGNRLLEVSVEDDICYINGKEVEFEGIAVEAVFAMLNFRDGESEWNYDAAVEEVAFSPLVEAMAIAEFQTK
ncbi:hypothetical protein [Lysinibacillus sp. fls2-241-R2A-57]|uniref:hypothetical protein n=1 Tax=Lysinibacillus sp. fls2-241-R2A-57 TaxID=3040292 RepID=UPI002554895C|nr:hypothetical protein [Lysinibacillus sp. fls2-241-R2A-57]